MVRTKGRRKITVHEKAYVWYIKEGRESPCMLLHIAAMDKSLLLIYPLGLQNPFLLQKQANGYFTRYVPPFPVPESITPDTVSRLIAWAESGEHQVLFTGHPEYDLL